MTLPAIELNGVSKVFRLYPDLVRSRIKQRLLFWNRYYTEKTALREVSLRINPGEVVGVLGPNGAGKTTLLKVIAGISSATSGSVLCRGRVTAVLALGLGFHPRLTGMDNLMLAGMMLGMSREQVRGKLDWIIDFAELRDYIGQPLNSYSTGMRARLSFAVAACQEPEILIIDEALATGDIRFVQKCINRIHEITRSGTTALFVSHNIWSIKKLTSRSILLDGGRIVDDGETNLVADRYYEVMLKNEVFEKRAAAPGLSEYVGSGEVRLDAIRLLGADGKAADVLEAGAGAAIEMELVSAVDCDHLGFSLSCRRADGITPFVTGTMAGGVPDGEGIFRNLEFAVKKGRTTVSVQFDALHLAPGEFHLDLQLFDARDFSGYASAQQFYLKTHVLEFAVRKLGNPNRTAVYYQPARISLR